MRIWLKFPDLEIMINAESLDASIDAIMLAAIVISELKEKFDYGKPQIEMDVRDLSPGSK